MNFLLLLLSLRLASSTAQFFQDNVPGIPGEDYPFLSTIPFTSFSCFDRAQGYYADTEAQCQVFHICHDQRQSSFLCPNGTLFNQRIFVCDWWFKVDCSQAPNFYFLNEHVFQFGSDKEDFMMSFSKTGAVPSSEINNNALMSFSRNEDFAPRDRERPTNPFTKPGSIPAADTITSPLLQQLQEQFLKQQQELEQLKKQQEQVQQQFQQFRQPKQQTLQFQHPKQQFQEPQEQFQPLQQKFQPLQEPQQQQFHQQVQQQIIQQQQRPQQPVQTPEQSSYLPYSFNSYTYRRPSTSYGPPPPAAFVPTTQVFNEVTTTTTARATTARTTTVPPTTTRFTEELATVTFRETDARDREFEPLRFSSQLTPNLSMPYDGWLLSSQDPHQIINILRSSKVFVLHRLNDTEELSNLAKASSSTHDIFRSSDVGGSNFLRPLPAVESTTPRPSSRNNFAKQIIELKPAPPPTPRPVTTPAPATVSTAAYHQTVSHYHVRIPPHTPPTSTKFVAPPAVQPELRSTLQTLSVPKQQTSSYYAASNPFFGTLSKPITFQNPAASFDTSPRYGPQTYYQSFPNPVATIPPVPLPLEPSPPTMVFRNLTILKAAGQPAITTTTTAATTTTTTTPRPISTTLPSSSSSEVEVLNVQTVFNTQSSPDLQQARTQFSLNLGSGFRSPHYIVLTPNEIPFKASQPFGSNNLYWSPRTTTAAPMSTVRSTRDSVSRSYYPMPGKYPRHIESYQFRSRYYD